MEPTISQPAGEGPASTPTRAARLRPGAQRRMRIVLGVVAVLALLLVAAELGTSSPAVCGACHEMGPRSAAWHVSPHANVKCVKCHVAPHPWYAYPQTLYDRAALLGRDTVTHFGRAVSIVDTRPVGAKPLADSVCEQCHDPNRKPTAGLGILIDHPKHAKRNGSCVSCHITVAHPMPSRGTKLSFMGQCFTCHGVETGAKASGKCTLCHPADFEMKPASHGAPKWKQQHGKIALKDRSQCAMCHKQAFCDGCHGVRMPHPPTWARKDGHPVVAQRDPQVCMKCHGGKPDFCTMCHHKAYDATRGTWVKQHFDTVMTQGASFCLEKCHSPVFCSACHVRGGAAKANGDAGTASGG